MLFNIVTVAHSAIHMLISAGAECDGSNLLNEIQKKKATWVNTTTLERELISFLIPPIINPQFLFSVKIKVQLPPGKQSIALM